MIENCTIQSITSPPQPTGHGSTTPGTTTNLTDVRGFLDEPRRAQMLALANKISDASATLMAPMAIAAHLVPQARVVVKLDEVGTQPTMQILHAQPRIKEGGLSHVEVYLKRA